MHNSELGKSYSQELFKLTVKQVKGPLADKVSWLPVS